MLSCETGSSSVCRLLLEPLAEQLPDGRQRPGEGQALPAGRARITFGCRVDKMSSLGVEPELSQPQRDVLTTIRTLATKTQCDIHGTDDAQ